MERSGMLINIWQLPRSSRSSSCFDVELLVSSYKSF